MSLEHIKVDQPRGNIFAYIIAKIVLSALGWKVKGSIPHGQKFVLVCAPHTSNWDFLFLKLTMAVYRQKVYWMGKDALFNPPFGWLMKQLGGIPIERSHHHGVVEQVVEVFNKSHHLVIAVPPSGTRGKRDYWKSGFYWISMKAQVPFLLGYLDYPKKEAAIGDSFMPSGDVKQDMERIRAFYAGKSGKNQGTAATIRLRDEDASEVLH